LARLPGGMDDLLYVGVTCLFFVLALLVLKGVDRL
jgi:hypothetical protein